MIEADYIGGNRAYRRRLVKFYKACKNLKNTVIVVRTDLTSSDFGAVQNFSVLELDLPVIPISDLVGQLPQLLLQLIQTEPNRKKVNPFKFGLPKNSTGVPQVDKDLILTLQTVQGLGDKKARALLNNFANIKEIAEASETDLAQIVGSGSARAVYHFFKKTSK